MQVNKAVGFLIRMDSERESITDNEIVEENSSVVDAVSVSCGESLGISGKNGR